MGKTIKVIILFVPETRRRPLSGHDGIMRTSHVLARSTCSLHAPMVYTVGLCHQLMPFSRVSRERTVSAFGCFLNVKCILVPRVRVRDQRPSVTRDGNWTAFPAPSLTRFCSFVMCLGNIRDYTRAFHQQMVLSVLVVAQSLH